jgi:hypothetical protein
MLINLSEKPRTRLEEAVGPSGSVIGHSSPDLGCGNVVKINKIEDVWHSEYNRAILYNSTERIKAK